AGATRRLRRARLTRPQTPTTPSTARRRHMLTLASLLCGWKGAVTRTSLQGRRHAKRHGGAEKRHAARRMRHERVTIWEKGGGATIPSAVRPTSTSTSAVRVLAVVPARGGSKGIPRKSLHLLAGRPLVAHAVAAGLAA